MNKINFLLLSVIVVFQCCTTVTNELKPDETAGKIFTSAELNGLTEMIKFVDNIVLATEKGADINQSYHAPFSRFDSLITEGKMIPGLVADSTKLKILEAIGDEAFAAVWKICETKNRGNGVDSIVAGSPALKSLTLNYAGKYMTYLNETGKTDSLYANLFKNIESAGDIPPTVVAWYPAQTKEINFTAFNARLWAAVYLLRLNPPSEIKAE